MIKVYCDSYGRVRLIGTGIKDNEIVRATGDFFYLSPEDTERFKRIGHANIYELMFKNDDGDYVIFELTNATGVASIIEITKDKKEYIKDNGDGLSSALELISDNDVPFANPEPPTHPPADNLEQQSVLTKPRKKLNPIERDANEGLLLVYEVTKHYNVQYLDELKAINAWNRIVAGEFKSDLIKSIADNKRGIILNSGTAEFGKDAFLRKYNSRFAENNTSSKKTQGAI
ncbi:MAG: hypothetical protein WBI40_00970 [Methylococcaceae bacterium]